MLTLDRLHEMSYWEAPQLPTLQNPHNYPYYGFLYHVAKAIGPAMILEIGTDKGDSACHMAAARADNRIVTVDQAASPVIEDRIRPFPNITFLHDNVNRVPGLPADLSELVNTYSPNHGYDLFFEDGEHSGNQVSGEWQWYVPLVRSGGLIIMDDINLPTGIREFWDAITWPKIELPHLHDTGFGVVIKP
jgi:predicted O-methyltransferase YrrM